YGWQTMDVPADVRGRESGRRGRFIAARKSAKPDQRAEGGAHLLKTVTDLRRLLTARDHRQCERCKRDQSAGARGFRDFFLLAAGEGESPTAGGLR
ncbi:MAG TPA: hypothetical protein VMI06_16090, partial [Terriglobia bacterium]|nr:hypothetical protein [Terriglobia bacterium]